MPTWDDLRYLLAVHREGSLADAARALHVAPSTVGRRIAAYERHLGARLLARTREGALLTPAGRRVVAAAGEVETGVHQAEREAVGDDAALEGRVRITAGDGFVPFLGPVVAQLHERYPALRVELSIDARVHDLVRHEADLALRTVRPSAASLVAKRLGTLSIQLFAARPYLARAPVLYTARDLAAHDVLGYDGLLAALPEMRWLEDHGVTRWPLRANSTMALLEGCVAGLGLMALPSAMARLRPELVRVLPDVVLPSATVWLVVPGGQQRVARIRVVADAVAEAFAREAGRE